MRPVDPMRRSLRSLATGWDKCLSGIGLQPDCGFQPCRAGCFHSLFLLFPLIILAVFTHYSCCLLSLFLLLSLTFHRKWAFLCLTFYEKQVFLSLTFYESSIFAANANDMKFLKSIFNYCTTALLLLCLSACDPVGSTAYEQKALSYLYQYMPPADSLDYSESFHLLNIRASVTAREEMPWGKKVPEPLFRRFVLPVRVNNEHLDSARVVFYPELKARVEHLSMQDAILEVNHWCHEKATYQPSDARTSSPLATVRTAYGRCGEESTLLVAALRAVAIPARQVYTPRWAHTDDNHAWVEAWADGQWYFLGACEPEPVLNLGWFNAPASRGMLMTARVFGDDNDGTDEVLNVTPNYTEINVTSHYAPVSKAVVTVTDEHGLPVHGATVEFKVYNYAEFYTVASKQTDSTGSCSLTAGRGDMLVWASKGGRFGYGKLSFGKEDAITLQLDKKVGDVFSEELTIVPPPEQTVLPPVTPEQRKENDRRLAQEDSIRHAYEATMLSLDSARCRASSLPNLTPEESETVARYLVASRGNHAVLTDFLKEAAYNRLMPFNSKVMADQTSNRLHTAVKLLSLLSAKDLRDVRMEVLQDHLYQSVDTVPDVLNPRVANEELTPYKSFLFGCFSMDHIRMFRENPSKLREWVDNYVQLDAREGMQRIPISPGSVYRAQRADVYSRDIFYVACARSLGIPARLNEVTGEVNDADTPMGKVSATYSPTRTLDNPKYYTHFTLSKIDNGVLRLQNYDEEHTTWQSLLKNGTTMPDGCYLLTTGTRLANGSVLARLSSFNVSTEKPAHVELVMREDPSQVSVIGSFNSESLYTPYGDKPKQSLLQACGRGYFIVGILGEGQEPSNHALRDIAALKRDLEKWGRKMLLLFPDEKQAEKFSNKIDDFPNLPEEVIEWGIDTDGIAAQIRENLKLKPDALPVFIIADTFNRVVFVSQGYTIGLGEQLIKTIKGLG
jgi:transglutaminase-like putative cysteine protease